MLNNFRIALTSLGSNKLRAFLTMLGITIGVAAVIVLVSVGQAFETFVNTQFQGIGVNLLFVSGNGPDPLTDDDVDVLSDIIRVPDIAIVMPQRNVNRSVSYEGRETSLSIQGVTPDFLTVYSRDVVAGRFIDFGDVDSASRVAVIGQGVLDSLFPDVYPVGQNIRIGDVRFTVIGVMDGAEGALFSNNNTIIVPITTVQTRLSGERVISGNRPVSFILMQAISSDAISSAQQQITQALRETRGISFRDEDDFLIITQTDLLQTANDIAGLLTVFLALLASISLVVGGIGIMNIMMVTVTERTREIGLRKAVGAQKSDILLQFLTEAVVLSAVGGAVGVAIAVAGSLLVSLIVPDLSVTVQVSSVVLATVISIVIGVFFGIYPANRAASLNPIDALRYE